MIKCENECPKGKFDGCCHECPEFGKCDRQCDGTPGECEQATFDENAGLIAFQDSQHAVMQQVCDIVTAKKKLDEQEKALKEQLRLAMEKFGVKKFESDLLTITYIGETTAVSVDTTQLKKLHPDIVEECSKTSVKSAYIKIETKGVK